MHSVARAPAPLESFRVSVLWKADVYASASERAARQADPLSMQSVADTINGDLARRGSEIRMVGALRSVFDGA